jgi:hypothetical protein
MTLGPSIIVGVRVTSFKMPFLPGNSILSHFSLTIAIFCHPFRWRHVLNAFLEMFLQYLPTMVKALALVEPYTNTSPPKHIQPQRQC